MRKVTEVNMEAFLVGQLLQDPDTGPDEIIEMDLQGLWAFGREWTAAEVKEEFGNLAQWIVHNDDGEDWE